MTSSRFREKFLAALEHIALCVRRIVVGELPQQLAEWRASNSRALSMCRDGLSDDEVEGLLTFFNGKYGTGWQHYCGPGCCESNEDFLANRGFKGFCGSEGSTIMGNSSF